MDRDNGTSNSIMIEITQPSEIKRDACKKSLGQGVIHSFNGWIKGVSEFCKQDWNRLIFSMKMGLALLLASLLVLIRAPSDVFGGPIVWAAITVVFMFEYTVGATLNRGINRAVGTILAGVFAVAVIEVAACSGHVMEPVIIGVCIYLIGALASFMKLWPSLMAYDYGFRVIVLTFCLLIASGYRDGNPLRMAIIRLYSVCIGGLVAILVNVLIFPVWAGEQLHRELVKSFNSVADSLEECVRKYVEQEGSELSKFTRTATAGFEDELAFRKCCTTLNSAAQLDSLANSAKWEPPHGRFGQFSYPWSEYVKVGAVVRHSAYQVMALHGLLHSEIQAPLNLRMAFGVDIREASGEAAEVMRSLGKKIDNMELGTQTSSLLKTLHHSTERLRYCLEIHSYLVMGNQGDCFINRGLSKDADHDQTEINSHQNFELTSMNKKQQLRRVFSFPSTEVDKLQGHGLNSLVAPSLRAHQSTTAQALPTFMSLLMEFVARLQHLVDAVDELAMLADFK